jgi:glycosyltransferase involved in cell wall biosynthesis
VKLLFCCAEYWPSVGGVQEVIRQIAERMAARGHDVTVATSSHPHRKSTFINGVNVREFKAGGKIAYGLNGQIGEYREFVRTFEADAILIMAAQQWSFDSLWPVLDDIKARKVFIPCGFSGLFEPAFARYFRELPDVLRKFDHLVFNAEKYRDIDFVRNIGLTKFTVLPNGISEADFEQEADDGFRQKLAIPNNAFLFLTVGNPIDGKGHREVVDAFSRLDTEGQPAVLLSIARWPAGGSGSSGHLRLAAHMSHRLREIARLEGVRGLAQLVRRKVVDSRFGTAVRYPGVAAHRLLCIVRVEGWDGIKQLARRKVTRYSAMMRQRVPPLESIESMATRASAQPFKRVILTDLERRDLIQAYFAADLFVFASQIEYSPLVLFEAAAAGTPFLTVPVGNANEIVHWTGGGVLCEAAKDSRGYTRVDPETLAGEMARCMKDREMLSRLGATARERWRTYFTWKIVAGYYEDILAGRTPDVRSTEIVDMTPDNPAISSVA